MRSGGQAQPVPTLDQEIEGSNPSSPANPIRAHDLTGQRKIRHVTLERRVSRLATYDPGGRALNRTADVRIRVMERADVAAVASIEAARDGGAPDPFDARLRRQLTDQAMLLLVAVIDGDIVGYGRAAFIARPADAAADWIPEGWYLVGLVVVDAWRRAGVGRTLTAARLAWIAEWADRAYYFTNARNQVSLDLHRKLGFRELSRAFTGPGIQFDGGHGVLEVIELAERVTIP